MDFKPDSIGGGSPEARMAEIFQIPEIAADVKFRQGKQEDYLVAELGEIQTDPLAYYTTLLEGTVDESDDSPTTKTFNESLRIKFRKIIGSIHAINSKYGIKAPVEATPAPAVVEPAPAPKPIKSPTPIVVPPPAPVETPAPAAEITKTIPPEAREKSAAREVDLSPHLDAPEPTTPPPTPVELPPVAFNTPRITWVAPEPKPIKPPAPIIPPAPEPVPTQTLEVTPPPPIVIPAPLVVEPAPHPAIEWRPQEPLRMPIERNVEQDQLRLEEETFEKAKRVLTGMPIALSFGYIQERFDIKTFAAGRRLMDRLVKEGVIRVSEQMSSALENELLNLATLQREKEELREMILALPEDAIEGAENLETKTFSKEYIRDTIQEILTAHKNIKKVEKISVNAYSDWVLDFEIKLTARKWMQTSDIDLSMAIGMEGGKISGDIIQLTATRAEKDVRELITKKLESIEEELKKYIEKKEGKKVEKVEIAEGQLKVTFA